MARKILVVLGHPLTDSFDGALAAAYAEGATGAGAQVEVLKLGELAFDPLLHQGYRVIQPLEPDLVRAQELVGWAEHIAFVYPNWWGTMPALMKGFFDRAFLPGFAFRYRKDSPWWDKLLAGRTAHLVVTMDTPPWYYRWVYRAPGHAQMKRTILGFCGIKVTRIVSLGSMEGTRPERRAAWLGEVRALGASAGR